MCGQVVRLVVLIAGAGDSSLLSDRIHTTNFSFSIRQDYEQIGAALYNDSKHHQSSGFVENLFY